ncbi:sensor histidine kinase [Pseudoflavonifractor sp. 60]|uniref:HAMP domain-containing sensor histidine kinase n=1 Tax=Pseudoflavonifractor sp. 60 TaxID=2304576 RepID=UPI00136BA154|nr:HAMP domain-containing sensor histidine kinase [Pseudoflavonifractor sp. 60]NBI68379.1 sensor histidine kinase [Pseudoflavonifractor sp. 60]
MKRISRWLAALWKYLVFFLLIAFVVSCCMILFLEILQEEMGTALTQEMIETAAKLTVGNVILISLLCTVLDGVRRWFLVTRPVRRIAQAARKITQGDFSVRIRPVFSVDRQDGLNTIIRSFNQMAEELSGIETLRTDFISNVSHELKTPLAVIQNYGALLQQPDLPEERRIEYAKAVTDASRRLANLITNILRLNKLENQQIFPENKTLDLGEQLCECLLAFEDIWEEKDITIHTELAEEIQIKSDVELLSLVWNNLFSNALKFTPRGGCVSVRLWTEPSYAVVEVSDTGCGISPQVGARIFEKFYQGDTSHAAQGNGLGLALVKRVVDIVEGDISVSSEVGRGSQFIVKIRRAEHGTD